MAVVWDRREGQRRFSSAAQPSAQPGERGRRPGVRSFASFCLYASFWFCCIFALALLASPPPGGDLWLSFGLCRTDAARRRLDAELSAPAWTHWASLPLGAEESCPARARGAPSSLTLEPGQLPPLFGALGHGSRTLIVKVMRDAFTAGNVTLAVRNGEGTRLLNPATYELFYVTANSAVACNASGAVGPCAQAAQPGVGGEEEPAVADSRAGSLDAAARRRRLRTGAAAERRARFGGGVPAGAGRRLLKGGSSFSGGGSGGSSRGYPSSASRGFYSPLGRAQPRASSSSALLSSRVAQARAAGPGYAYYASPTRFTRPSALPAGSAFLMLHTGSRQAYPRGYAPGCAEEGCEIAVDADLAVDELLDSAFTLRPSDFPITFELLGAQLALGGAGGAAGYARAPLLLFSLEAL